MTFSLARHVSQIESRLWDGLGRYFNCFNSVSNVILDFQKLYILVLINHGSSANQSRQPPKQRYLLGTPFVDNTFEAKTHNYFSL
jgi:hypothetical protein